jgi:hypothetical protein
MKHQNKIGYIILFAMLFGCSEGKKETLNTALQKLCSCENATGKTIDSLTKELLGNDLYINSANAQSFSIAIDKLDPALCDGWLKALERDFLSDVKYLKCVKSTLTPLKTIFEGSNSTNAKELEDIFNQPKYFTVYRLLPTLLTVAEQK